MAAASEVRTLFQRELVVERYFQTFNESNFEATAKLFAKEGELAAPFEEPIRGREHIEAYLEREAQGMKAFPKEMCVEPLERDRRQVVVKGEVQASVFNVNAAWIFTLNSQDEIEFVRVKLLASLQDLVSLRK